MTEEKQTELTSLRTIKRWTNNLTVLFFVTTLFAIVLMPWAFTFAIKLGISALILTLFFNYMDNEVANKLKKLDDTKPETTP